MRPARRAASWRQQAIGCNTFYDPTNRLNQATCIAIDAKGNYASCVTQDPTIVAVTFAITADSQIAFSWNDRQECVHIGVSNSSFFEPKLPRRPTRARSRCRARCRRRPGTRP